MSQLPDQAKELELLCDGYYYDLTSFADRHPGGPIIKFYLNSGEDATEAIQQFHARSAPRVDRILGSLPKRKASESDCTSCEKHEHLFLSLSFQF